MNWLRYSSNIFIFRVWLFQITFQLRLAGNHVFPRFVPAGACAEGLAACQLKRELVLHCTSFQTPYLPAFGRPLALKAGKRCHYKRQRDSEENWQIAAPPPPTRPLERSSEQGMKTQTFEDPRTERMWVWRLGNSANGRAARQCLDFSNIRWSAGQPKLPRKVCGGIVGSW